MQIRSTAYKTILWASAWLLAVYITLPVPTYAADAKVWLNTKSGVYHCPGTRYYSNTKKGRLLPEAEAIKLGYRGAHGKVCDPTIANTTKNAIKQSFATKAPGNDVKVWVNAKSHVYHCPGTRWYGKTKRGTFMQESDALSSGNRPSHGQRCR